MQLDKMPRSDYYPSVRHISVRPVEPKSHLVLLLRGSARIAH